MDTLSVLLIDDEQEFVITLAERLELRGLRVRTASNGQEGLLKVMQEVPDVVIVDMFMPGLSGADIVQALKSRFPHLPLIMLTGHSGVDDAGEIPLAGVYTCLTKPVSLEIVLDSLHAAVKEAQQATHPGRCTCTAMNA